MSSALGLLFTDRKSLLAEAAFCSLLERAKIPLYDRAFEFLSVVSEAPKYPVVKVWFLAGTDVG